MPEEVGTRSAGAVEILELERVRSAGRKEGCILGAKAIPLFPPVDRDAVLSI